MEDHGIKDAEMMGRIQLALFKRRNRMVTDFEHVALQPQYKLAKKPVEIEKTLCSSVRSLFRCK